MNLVQPRALFDHFYALGLQHRNTFRDCDALVRWFPQQIKSYPPIICFGFPGDPEECIPIVTLGINPSPREISKRCVKKDDDPGVQFKQQATYFERGRLGWFDKAQLILQTLSEDLPREQRATYGGTLGGKRNAVHLDLSPVITAPIYETRNKAGKLLHALSDARDYAEQVADIELLTDYQTDLDLESERLAKAPAELRKLLTRGAQEIMEPLLTELIGRHRVKVVIALGGLDWLKKVGLGANTCRQKWPMIDWVFLGSGPSARGTADELVAKTRQHTTAKKVITQHLA